MPAATLVIILDLASFIDYVEKNYSQFILCCMSQNSKLAEIKINHKL